ncbi:MAG: phosphodiester glycosidase family protein [Sporichthyaceae bacterium]
MPSRFAGTTGDGRIVLATIGSRVTPRQAAGIAARLGMTEAINLDGGGSSTLAIRGRAVNRSGERAVADALVWKVAGTGGAKQSSARATRRPGAKKAATSVPTGDPWVWFG